MILVTNKMKVTGLVILKSGFSIPEEPLIEEDNGGITDPVTDTSDNGNVDEPVTETDDNGPVARGGPTEPEEPTGPQEATFNRPPGTYDYSGGMSPGGSGGSLYVTNRDTVIWTVTAGAPTNHGPPGGFPTPYLIGEESNYTASGVEFSMWYQSGGPWTMPVTVTAYDTELNQTFTWNYVLYHEYIG